MAITRTATTLWPASGAFAASGTSTITHSVAAGVTPDAVVVSITVDNGGATDQVSGVTYGGVALKKVAGTNFTAGSVDPNVQIWVGVNLAWGSGPQTVAITSTGTLQKKGYIQSFTTDLAGGALAVDTFASVSGNTGTPGVTLGTTTGRSTYCIAALMSDANTPITSGLTSGVHDASYDFTSEIAQFAHATGTGGNVTISWTSAVGDSQGWACSGVALYEEQGFDAAVDTGGAPLYHWKLGEAAGATRVKDRKKNYPTDLLKNGVTLGTTGLVANNGGDTAASFTPTANFYDDALTPPTRPETAWTWVVYITPQTTGADQEVVCWDLGYPHQFCGIEINAAFQPQVWRHAAGDTYPFVVSPTALTAGQTYRLTARWDGSTLDLRVNAVTVATLTGDTAAMYTSGITPAAIMASGAGGIKPYSGVMDEVMWFDVAISDAKDQADYIAGGGVVFPSGGDDTAALQAWIDAQPDGTAGSPTVLTFPAGAGTYRVDTQLTLTNRNHLTLDLNGTTIQWNTPDDDSKRLFLFTTCTDIHVKNGTLLGTYTFPTSGDAHLPLLQHMHAIHADGSEVYVEDSLTIDGFKGDGVYYGNNGATLASGGIDNTCTIQRVGRNGVSGVGCDNVVVSCHIERCGWAWFDLEPNADTDNQRVTNFDINGCSFGTQGGATFNWGVVIEPFSGGTNSQVTDVKIRNCTSTEQDLYIRIGDTDGTGQSRPQRILIENNHQTGAGQQAWMVEAYRVDTLDITGNDATAATSVIAHLTDCTDVYIPDSTFDGTGNTFRASIPTAPGWHIDGNLIRDSADQRIVLRGATAWMLPMFGPWADFVANADEQYQNRDAIFAEMASLNINVVRIGLSPASLATGDDGTAADIYSRARDIVISAANAGLMTMFTFWADTTPIADPALTTHLGVIDSLLTAVSDVMDWVIINPCNEPHEITATEWQDFTTTCLNHVRELSYPGIVVLDPNSWAGIFADEITNIAAVQALDTNILWSCHLYATGQPAFSGPTQTYNGTNWFEPQFGVYAEDYAIATTESGIQNGDASTIVLNWNQEFQDYTAETLVPRGWNGHMEFLWAWVDNAITDADSGNGTDTLTDLTTLNVDHGEMTRDRIWNVLVDGVEPTSARPFDPPTVDDFNRADGAVGPTNWLYNDTNVMGIYPGATIASNVIEAEDRTNGWGMIAWAAQATRPDVAYEVSAAWTTGHVDICLVQDSSNYYIVTGYSGGDGTGRADIYKNIAGAGDVYVTTIVTGTWGVGARLGVRRDGNLLEVYWSDPASSDWTRFTISPQAELPGPFYAALRWDFGTDLAARLDNFAFFDPDAPVEIGHSAFPGGTWGAPSDGHIQAQLCTGVPEGTISASQAYIRRDVAGTTEQVRMAVYSSDGSVRYGVSDDYTINDSNATAGTFVWTQHTFTWSTPANIPAGDVLLVLQYGPGAENLQMGATSGEGGGVDYDGYTFSSGAPTSLTGGSVRTASFPISAIVVPGSTPTTFMQAITASASNAVALVRQSAKLINLTRASTASIKKAITKAPIAVARASTATVKKAVTKGAITVARATSATATKKTAKSFTIPRASAASVAKRAGKVVNVTRGSAASLAKQTGKVLSIARSSSASILKAITRSMLVTRASNASLSKVTSKQLLVARASAASVVKKIAKAFSISGSTSGSSTTVANPAQVTWGAWIRDMATGTEAPFDPTAIDRFARQSGNHYPGIIHWSSNFSDGSGNFSPWVDADADVVVEYGAVPLRSWAPGPGGAAEGGMTPRAIAAGAQDTYITEFAQAIAAWGQRVILRFAWEMNGNWFPWGIGVDADGGPNTAAEYVAMWRHVHDIFVAQGATNVEWFWCPNVDFVGAPASLADVYPGDAYVDWVGCDGYNADDGHWDSFHDVHKATYDAITGTIAPGKPYMIGEFGSTENGGDKAQWFTDMWADLPVNFPLLKGLVIFSHDAFSGLDYPITSSNAAELAWATGLADSRNEGAPAHPAPHPSGWTYNSATDAATIDLYPIGCVVGDLLVANLVSFNNRTFTSPGWEAQGTVQTGPNGGRTSQIFTRTHDGSTLYTFTAAGAGVGDFHEGIIAGISSFALSSPIDDIKAAQVTGATPSAPSVVATGPDLLLTFLARVDYGPDGGTWNGQPVPSGTIPIGRSGGLSVSYENVDAGATSDRTATINDTDWIAQSVLVKSSPSGAAEIQKIVSITAATTSLLTRRVAKAILVTRASSANILRSVIKSLTVARPSSASTSKMTRKPITVSRGSSATAVKLPNKLVEVAQASLASLGNRAITKAISMVEAVSVFSQIASSSLTSLTLTAFAGSTATMQRRLSAFREFSVSAASSASAAKGRALVLLASASTALQLMRRAGKTETTSAPTTSSVSKSTTKSFSAAVASVASAVRGSARDVVISVTASTASSISRRVNLTRTASVAAVPSMLRRISVSRLIAAVSQATAGRGHDVVVSVVANVTATARAIFGSLKPSDLIVTLVRKTTNLILHRYDTVIRPKDETHLWSGDADTPSSLAIEEYSVAPAPGTSTYLALEKQTVIAQVDDDDEDVLTLTVSESVDEFLLKP